MIHLTETWRTVIDCGKFVAVPFIDFRKAFDSVSHATLIMKLERHFGIRGSTRDWLKSYLTGRKQFTVLNPKDRLCSHYSQTICHHLSGRRLYICFPTIQIDYCIESAPYGFLFTSRKTLETNE